MFSAQPARHSWLTRARRPREERRAAAFFRQIMLGVAYCHGRGVCHRDLKLENILLNDAGDRVKIADFGFGPIQRLML